VFKYKLILSLLLFFISVTCYAERVVTLRVNDSYAPFEYINKDDKPVGFTIEIFDAINHINRINYTTKSNKEIFNFYSTVLDSSEIATSMDSIPSHSEFIASQPFGYIDHDIVARVFSGIHSWKDLDGRTVLIVKHSPIIDYLKEYNIKVDFVFIKNVSDGLRLLSSGKYDAMITSNDAAYFYINKHNLTNLSVRRLFCQPLSIKFVMLNTPQNQLIIDKINSSLRTIRSNGTYDSIYFKRFYPINEDSIQPFEITFLIIGVVITMILIFYVLYVHWLYQAEKKKKSPVIIDDTPLITNMQKIYDSIPTITVYFDNLGKLKFINKAGYELVNSSRRTKLYFNENSIFEHTILNNEMIDKLKNKTAIHFTYNLISKDSIFNHLGDFVLPKDKIYSIYIIPIANYGTALTGYISYIYDITELHTLSQKNLQYVTSLSQISENHLLNICYYDSEEDRFYSFSDNKAHNTGFSYEQVLSYIHPLSRSLFIEEFLSILNGEKRSAHISIKVALGNSNIYESREIILNAIRVDSNTTIGISLASSISDNSNVALSKHKELQNKLDFLMKSSEYQFLEFNPQSQIFNITTLDNSHRILDYEKMNNSIHPDDRGKSEEIIQEMLSNQKENAYLVLRIKTGLSDKYQYYRINLHSYYDPNTANQYIIGVYHNISDNVLRLHDLEEFKESVTELCKANSIGVFEFIPYEIEHYIVPDYFYDKYGVNDDNFTSLMDNESQDKFDELLSKLNNKTEHIDKTIVKLKSPITNNWVAFEFTIKSLYDETTQDINKYLGVIKDLSV